MKNLLATTALVAGMAGVAFAQTAPATPPAAETPPAAGMTQTETAPMGADRLGFVTSAQATDIHGSDLIGATIYAADYDGDAQGYFRREDAAFESIGSVNDVLMSRDGEVRAVLVDIGGFLGMGAHTVALDMDSLSFVTESDDARDWRIVVDASRDALEDAPAYEENERQVRAQSPLVRRDGWATAEEDALTADKLMGVAVYDVNDENIGSVADFVVTENGSIEQAVLDVGGWLGIGAHRVAVPFQQMRILRETDGDDMRAYVDVSEERLREMPSFEG